MKIEKLRQSFQGLIAEREPMSRHTSFGIGGPADLFLVPENLRDLKTALLFVREQSLPFFILGKGTNILVSDEGIAGVVIKLEKSFSRVRFRSPLVSAGAGVTLSRLADLAAEKGLAGLECGGGIPGSLGGGLVMNAGAYGWSLGEQVKSIRILDERGVLRVIPGEKWGFGYRQGGRKPGWAILGATLKLTPGDPEKIREALKSMREMRAAGQPLDMRSAGCVFRNPGEKRAWELVHGVGGTGLAKGGAMVSTRHSNFIVNTGGARAEEVWALVEELKRRIRLQYQIEIVPEIIRVGRW
ncbi:MAG: UDP-N-acetylmuramate dehydrogenase [bacterium]